MAKSKTKPKIKYSKAAQRFACVICGSRKDAEQFPLDEDHHVRVTITCTACLAPTHMADRSDAGLIEQLRVDVNNLENKNESIAANVLKRKHGASLEVLSNRQKKKTKFNLPKPAAPPPTSATCSICCEDKPALEFPMRPPHRRKALSTYSDVPISCAKHLNVACKTPVCKRCITAYLTASLELKGADKLGCPAMDCGAVWGQNFIQAYLTVHAFANYSQQLFQQLMAQENVIWCYDPQCGEGGIIESHNGIKATPAGYPNLECASCKKRQCVLCRVEWHKDMTCQQYRENHGEDRDAEEQQVLRMMVRRGARRCRHCQLAVEKDGGCDYMFCMRSTKTLPPFFPGYANVLTTIIGPHCHQQFYWLTAEPVRANIIATRQAAKKEEPALSISDPLSRICEADAAARRAAAVAAARNRPIQQPDWDMNIVGLPLDNFFDMVMGHEG